MQCGNEFFEEYGYRRCREKQLRALAESREGSLSLEAANQIKHLKECLSELVSIVNIHSRATNSNFAWAELEEANTALGLPPSEQKPSEQELKTTAWARKNVEAEPEYFADFSKQAELKRLLPTRAVLFVDAMPLYVTGITRDKAGRPLNGTVKNGDWTLILNHEFKTASAAGVRSWPFKEVREVHLPESLKGDYNAIINWATDQLGAN